ncbi:MAG: dihydrolipoamide acetyltransferase family protein [Myxococcota bacterium]
MAEFYEMPSISPTMEVGTLVEWRIAEGASFESSAVVAEVGTDKANMDAEIFDPGVMLKHLIAEGDEVPPGFPIAIVGQSADEDVSALLAEFEQRKASLAEGGGESAPAEAPAPVPAAPAPTPAASAPVAPVSNGVTTDITRSWQGQPLSMDFAEPPGDLRFASEGGATRVLASPLARKVATEKGVDLGRLSGTGPGGRITRADVDKAPGGPVRSKNVPTLQEAVIRNSPMRKTIAKRLLAFTEIPAFYLTVNYDMQGFVDMRKALKVQLPDVKISYNDILIKAVARALVDHPEVNASWSDQSITQHGRVDIGVAVAIDQGLITPIVRNADFKPLSEVATEVRELAGRARAMRLAPEEYTGATFTISNLGMFGIEHFTAIINPPESAILAVGGIEQVPVVVDGELTTGWRMKATMTCDHRVIDGAVGAQFLQTLRKYVENPWLALHPDL